MGRSVSRATLATLVIIGTAVVGSDPVAASVACTGVLSGTVNDTVVVPPDANCFILNATIHGNVKVSPTATLELGVGFGHPEQQNVIYGSVSGNPTIGAFTTFGANTVTGNVVLDGLNGLPPESNATDICGMTIGGSLVVTNARPAANFVSIGDPGRECDPVTVGGYVVVRGNKLPIGDCGGTPCPFSGVRIVAAHIGGALVVTHNASPGSVFGGLIAGSTISGGLYCGGNAPPLQATANTVSGPNQAAGGSC